MDRAQLTAKDLEVLGRYASHGNRELYWNALAQHAGSDGYGLLALGVVRNDNAPGATANAFAAETARHVNGRVLSEREWNAFGVDLMQRDFKLRGAYFDGGRADLALNLPARDVQQVHDDAFDNAGIARDAWTPRQLLEAARRKGGEGEAGRVWSTMLDNSYVGLARMGATSRDIWGRLDDAQLDAPGYYARLTEARLLASQALPNTDPNRIGAESAYYLHGRDGWALVTRTASMAPHVRKVTDPVLTHQLDDTRALRLEREQLRRQFHPDDPARHHGIEKSPVVLADAAPAQEIPGPAVLDPATRQRLADVEGLVRAHDARTRAGWNDEEIRQLSLGLATMAAADPLVSKIDAVVGNTATADTPANARLFAVHRPYGEREPSFHAAVDVRTALAVPEARGIEALAHATAAEHARSSDQPTVQPVQAAARHHAHAL